VTDALCALVLAAGEGTRLRPITATVPKPLCPVGNVALLDRALARLAHHGFTGPARVAVNVCYLADRVSGHVGGRAYVSVEPGPPALGTSGAVANLRDWIAGRPVLVGNSDAYLVPADGSPTDLAALLDDWDGSTVRILAVPADDRPAEFGTLRFAGFSLLPGAVAAALAGGRADLVDTVWRPAEREGRLELVRYDGEYRDTGTPADLLAANLHAAAAGSLIAPNAHVTGSVEHAVVGADAEVHGSVAHSVVFPGGVVGPGERLESAIRVGRDLTVTVS
jgi:N-acetyl-alpha-D-muramate 1-phosphate uridylyltransferase